MSRKGVNLIGSYRKRCDWWRERVKKPDENFHATSPGMDTPLDPGVGDTNVV